MNPAIALALLLVAFGAQTSTTVAPPKPPAPEWPDPNLLAAIDAARSRHAGVCDQVASSLVALRDLERAHLEMSHTNPPAGTMPLADYLYRKYLGDLDETWARYEQASEWPTFSQLGTPTDDRTSVTVPMLQSQWRKSKIEVRIAYEAAIDAAEAADDALQASTLAAELAKELERFDCAPWIDHLAHEPVYTTGREWTRIADTGFYASPSPADDGALNPIGWERSTESKNFELKLGFMVSGKFDTARIVLTDAEGLRRTLILPRDRFQSGKRTIVLVQVSTRRVAVSVDGTFLLQSTPAALAPTPPEEARQFRIDFDSRNCNVKVEDARERAIGLDPNPLFTRGSRPRRTSPPIADARTQPADPKAPKTPKAPKDDTTDGAPKVADAPRKAPASRTVAWGTVLEPLPDPNVVTNEETRAAIAETGWPWKVREKKSGIVFLLVPPGEYRRGAVDDDPGAPDSERPSHMVRISRPFYLGMYEVQEAEWDKVVGSKVAVSHEPGLPRAGITLAELDEFLKAAPGLRLPTEGEWEYACRAGSRGKRYGEVLEVAWCKSNAEGKAHPVGLKAANAFGFHDMLGNVWEYCSDSFASDEYDVCAAGVVDPTGPGDETSRVIRGGSFNANFSDEQCRSTSRAAQLRNSRGYSTRGFRVAHDP